MSSRVFEPGVLLAGRYRVESTLGKGGMGVVLGVRDEKTGVPLALKLLEQPQLTTDASRLLREARALMLLSSPHVVRVFDVDEIPSVGPYIVLERLQGHTLAALAPLGKPLPYSIVARYAVHVCEALAQAHGLGIIHRDIKPSNLFVTFDADGNDIVKVLDFGISKLTHLSGEGLRTITASGGELLGSPQFISPEQLRDARSVDARTDIWGLGVTIYRLLSGRFPFEGGTVAEIFAEILQRSPPPLSSHGIAVPEALEKVLLRCLSRDREGRYASARDLAAALLPFTRERPVAVPPSRPTLDTPPCVTLDPVVEASSAPNFRTSRAWAWGAAAAVGAVIASALALSPTRAASGALSRPMPPHAAEPTAIAIAPAPAVPAPVAFSAALRPSAEDVVAAQAAAQPPSSGRARGAAPEGGRKAQFAAPTPSQVAKPKRTSPAQPSAVSAAPAPKPPAEALQPSSSLRPNPYH